MSEQNKTKSEAKILEEKLLIDHKHAGVSLEDKEIQDADQFCDAYKSFLDIAKTEREAVDTAIERAKAKGFVEFDYRKKYAAGDKVFYNNRGKAVILAILGTESIENGVKIAAAHIDSPRLDLKPRPLYEDSGMALFKTHYYGGIKKYQWTAMPLSLHGVIIKQDGTKITVCIGEDDNDPVFCVTDLLPHLATDQMKQTLADAIKGENLNILIGSRPFKDDEKSCKVKLNIIHILNQKYGIIEKDLLCAELEAVPAYKAKDVGFDRSMVGAYGHDDRVCAYTALEAILDCEAPRSTVVTILADKEETGSDGNTGLKCSYLKYFIADLAKPFGVEGRTVLSKSQCLSADVNAAFDPTYPEVSEKMNTAFLNYGVTVTKYTGSRGKAGTSDASAEFVANVCGILDKNKVIWQTGELGKVDQGGGGTVASYIANLNVDVVDVGVPVLSMHSPFELVSKIDVYMAYRAFLEFFKA
ncbi:MAG: putative aminopeptidase [Oscillospiraceae bacterium]|nr:putative aminopeptidase [Oscillospiraceae bacterium]